MPTFTKFQSDAAGNPILVKGLCLIHPVPTGRNALMLSLAGVATAIACDWGAPPDHRRYITKVEAEYTEGMVAVYAAVPEGVTAEEHWGALAEVLMGLGLGVCTPPHVTVCQVG